MVSHAQAETGAVKYKGSSTCLPDIKKVSAYPQRIDTADELAIANAKGKLFRELREMIAMRLQIVQAANISQTIRANGLLIPANIAAATQDTDDIKPVRKARMVEIP